MEREIQKSIKYGQGSTGELISDEFAEYALNLAATNIVLLVGIYKRGKVNIINNVDILYM